MITANDFLGMGGRRRITPVEYLPYLIIPGCVIFNFILCYINTRLFTVTIPMVIACEVVLVALSAVYGFFRIDKLKLYWLGILLLQIALILILSVYRQEFLMKPLRDMIIIPIFAVLGLSSLRLNVIPLLFWLSGIIIFFAMFEGFFLSTFTEYFNIRRYYVEKGVLGEDVFVPHDLGISGIRPNERFLVDLPFHRLSSVFLEPVSMGFVGFIIGLFFVSVKKHLSLAVYIAGLVCAYTIILISDGRMAFGSLTLILLLRPLLARTDHRFAILIFPALLTIGLTMYLSGAFGQTGEGIGWRIQDTMQKLSVIDLDLLLGTSLRTHHAEDSGLLKILQFQGVIGFLLFWLSPILFMRRLPEEPKIYLFGISLFLGFGFLLSAAILTIKSMALLWFLYGYLIVRAMEAQKASQIRESGPSPADISGR